MSEISEIAATVTSLAAPGMKPKDLMSAVREKHPDAPKKAIIRAAFYAAIEQAETDPHLASQIHGAAIGERGAGDDSGKSSKKKSKPKKD